MNDTQLRWCTSSNRKLRSCTIDVQHYSKLLCVIVDPYRIHEGGFAALCVCVCVFVCVRVQMHDK
jgi:hypothetical protein